MGSQWDSALMHAFIWNIKPRRFPFGRGSEFPCVLSHSRASQSYIISFSSSKKKRNSTVDSRRDNY